MSVTLLFHLCLSARFFNLLFSSGRKSCKLYSQGFGQFTSAQNLDTVVDLFDKTGLYHGGLVYNAARLKSFLKVADVDN